MSINKSVSPWCTTVPPSTVPPNAYIWYTVDKV